MSKFPLFRTAYDNLQKDYSDMTAIDFSYPEDDINHPSRSRTVQADAAETDMNVIMDKYIKTGLVPQGLAEPFYGDASALPDFMEAQQIIIDARNAFEALPAKLRDRFHNAPENFLAFMEDEANYDEAVALGLLVLKETPPEPPAAPPRRS